MCWLSSKAVVGNQLRLLHALLLAATFAPGAHGRAWMGMVTEPAIANCEIVPDAAGAGRLRLRLSGDWRLGARPTGADAATAAAGGSGIAWLFIEDGGIGHWDQSLPVFIFGLARQAQENGASLDLSRLPDGVRRLAGLATGAASLAAETGPTDPWLARIGKAAIAQAEGVTRLLAFLGEIILAIHRLLAGRSKMRLRDLSLAIEDAGARALPIVTLISLSIGVVLAFVGATQLRLFGADIFVANLVAVGMLREMGAMMPGIIIAGRTGAAYAAEIGTMQVNEEIDALETLAVSPYDFLVLPRVLALVLMMPLLALYANLMGFIGGGFMAWSVFGIEPQRYLVQAKLYIGLDDLMSGLVKAVVFGVIVAVAGCMRGLYCGRDAASVGKATTSAVVSSIVGIVLADSLLTMVYYVIGF